MHAAKIKKHRGGYLVLLFIDGEWCDEWQCSTWELAQEVARDWRARN